MQHYHYDIDMINSYQCWALAPLLAPPHHHATGPLSRNKKGGTNHGDAKLKNNGTVAVVRNQMVLIHTISAPFLNQILHKNHNKLLLL